MTHIVHNLLPNSLGDAASYIARQIFGPRNANPLPTGVASGSYGSATAVPVISISEDGRIVSASSTTIAPGSGGDNEAFIQPGHVFSSRNCDPHPNGVVAGTYGSATLSPVLKIGNDGRVVTATTTAIVAAPDITGLTAGDIDVEDYVPSYDTSASANRKVTVARHMGYAPCVPGGRLSTESGVPISTTDRASQATVYWVPYRHRWMPIYDGTRWVAWDINSYSTLALGTRTSGKNYDVVFIVLSGSGTPTIDLVPAWTNDSTRASGVSLVNGILVNTSSFTSVINSEVVAANCATVVGTIRTTSATTTEDSETKRFVYNFYNQVDRPLRKWDTTDTDNYSTAAWRQMFNSAANQVEILIGYAGSPLELWAHACMQSSTIQVGYTAIGEDSTAAPAAACITKPLPVSVNTGYSMGASHLVKCPAVGYHYYPWIQYGAGSGTQTWFGDAGVDPLFRAGMQGFVWS